MFPKDATAGLSADHEFISIKARQNNLVNLSIRKAVARPSQASALRHPLTVLRRSDLRFVRATTPHDAAANKQTFPA
uniref:Transposase n=1 Tax=Steinernema glaseri TaxID=37863 RepID=A0A1I7YFV6_9BILA